jgi:hypothetical protein
MSANLLSLDATLIEQTNLLSEFEESGKDGSMITLFWKLNFLHLQIVASFTHGRFLY